MHRSHRRLIPPLTAVVTVTACTQTVPVASPATPPDAPAATVAQPTTTTTTTISAASAATTTTSPSPPSITTTTSPPGWVATSVVPLDVGTPTTLVPLTAVQPAEFVIDEGAPMTLRLPVAPGHPTFDSIVTSWWALRRSTFERRAAAFERTRAAEAAAAEADAAAVPTTPGVSTSTTSTTTTTTVPPAPPELYVDHDPLVVGDQAAMIRLRTAAVFDGPPEFADATFYAFDHGDVLPGLALVDPARRSDLVDWLATVLGARADGWKSAPIDELLADVELTDTGTLRIGIPTRWLSPGPAVDRVELDVGASDAFLSDLGRALRDGDPIAPPWAAPADCAIDACVALTFDDGPVPATERLLNALSAARAPGTFFVLGRLVERHPELVLRIATEGHEIGNHGWAHDALSAMSADGQRDEIERTDAAIEAIVGFTPGLLRPPYGRYDGDTRWLGDAIVLWDVDTRDWQHRDPARTANAVTDQVQSGSIVLLHDLHATTIAAVPMIVARLRAAGYRLVTVSEILTTTDAGSVHRSRDDHEPPPPPTTTATTTTTTSTTVPSG